MHNPLPSNFDLHAEFKHPAFDAILEFFKPAFPDEVSCKVIVDGATNQSDIKWNNLSGRFRLAVVRPDAGEVASLIGCQIDCFTGNCGIKAIDHLHLFRHPSVPDTKEKYKELIKIVESFAYHKTNCGILIGSDTNTNYRGTTLTNIMEYGDGYVVTEPVWNPNYTWAKTHRISLFHKDLNAAEHTQYWGGTNNRG